MRNDELQFLLHLIDRDVVASDNEVVEVGVVLPARVAWPLINLPLQGNRQEEKERNDTPGFGFLYAGKGAPPLEDLDKPDFYLSEILASKPDNSYIILNRPASLSKGNHPVLRCLMLFFPTHREVFGHLLLVHKGIRVSQQRLWYGAFVTHESDSLSWT